MGRCKHTDTHKTETDQPRGPTDTYATRSYAPFCFTFSKDATKSDSEPGNAFGRVGGTCCGAVDAGRCAFGTTPGGTPCSLSATGALTPGGNWGT